MNANLGTGKENAMNSLDWKSGLDYDVIRKNRDEYLNSEIKRLIESGGVFLAEYPNYIIFRNGDIYSTLGRKITKLKPGRKKSGYRFVGLRGAQGERKYEMVHRLTAKTFVGNPGRKPEVNHKDGNKNNNCADNLEWVLPKENIRHAIKNGLIKTDLACKLNREAVISIFGANGRYRDIGAKFGVCAQTVCNIKKVRGAYGRMLIERGIVRVGK